MFSLLGPLLIAVGALWTGGLVFQHFRMAAKRRAARDWPSTPGRVRRSELIESGREGGQDRHERTYYRPLIEYAYQAQGAERTGTRVRFGPVGGGARAAREVVERYPVGAQPPVRVNPRNPGEAVLETNAGGAPILLLLAPGGLVFIVVGLVFTGL
jgi:hypothetical protein